MLICGSDKSSSFGTGHAIFDIFPFATSSGTVSCLLLLKRHRCAFNIGKLFSFGLVEFRKKCGKDHSDMKLPRV